MIYENKEQIIKEIKKLLIDEGISQKDVADALGIKPQGLVKILAKKNFGFGDAAKILNSIGYDLHIEFEEQ